MGDLVTDLGGQFVGRHGLDVDRIGYLDLADEVEKLGYTEFKMYYKIPGLSLDRGLKDMKDDKDCMEMLKILTGDLAMVQVYIEGVKSGSDENMVPQVPSEQKSEKK